MEDQLEEKDVLEMGNWNSEYDIAEEEEERLLEEHEITESKHGFPYESEQHFSDTEYEAPEVEEDILDLGLNEDIIEYEEVSTNCQEASKELKKNTSAQPNQELETCSTSQKTGTVDSASTQTLQKNFSVRSGQPASSFKNFNFKRQSNFPIPVQMRNAPPSRMGSPGFHNQRTHFDGPNRPLIGRAPSIMDYHGARSGFSRHSMQIGCEPLFVQDFHHGFSTQRFQRFPIKDHHLVNHHQFMEYDRNNSINRLFINPHYQGSVTIQNGCASRVTPLTEPRLNFSHSDNAPPRFAFQARHQRPPPGPNLANAPRPASFAPMRFVQPLQSSLPPPRLNGPIDQISPPRFKSAHPQNLMDMILPAPFGDVPLRAPYHPEQQRPQRFRFNSFDPPPPHSYDHSPSQPVRFLTPLATASKRPAPTEASVTAPLKQLRLGPTGNIQVMRTFAPPNVSLNSPPPTTVTNVLPPGSATLTQVPPPNIRPPQFSAPIRKPPPIMNSSATPVIPTTISPSSTIQSSAMSAPMVSESSSTSASTSTLNVTEDISSEMKDYLEKMEEQRKKREEVLKMKEERRRQKLATMAGKDEFSSAAIPTQPGNSGSANPSTTTVSPTSRLPDTNKQPNTSAHHSPFSRLDVGSSLPQTGSFTVKENSVSPTLRKTVLVKPTPTVQTSVRGIPQAAVGVNRRYKIIIVKNKSGKILEKRRVPIDEPSSGNNHDNPLGHVIHTSPSSLLQTPARISETVTIENLNMNATEDYVWKLCQMYGPVQEVYPKLQEGKAIVRFSSSSGANNFITNHNTPGICVRFL